MQITDIRIRKIAKEYDVQLADMTDGEYEKYYFEDESHLALKGLVTMITTWGGSLQADSGCTATP